jgi:hypothetical protein
MNIKDPSRILDEIAREAVPQDVNLLPGVLSRVQKTRNLTSHRNLRLAVASLTALILIVSSAFAFPEVAGAMRRLLGFIPGVGLVDQTLPLRAQPGPAAQSRDGYTVTVENAIIDTQHTIISFKVEGPFEGESAQPAGNITGLCFRSPTLRLPDETVFTAPDDLPAETWQNGYRAQVSYPSLPADINEAVLVQPCLHGLPAGQGPQDWEIPLSFVPAPPEMTVFPISAPSTSTPAPAPSVSTEVPASEAIHLNLESVIPVSDGQLVQVRIDWSGDPKIADVAIHPEDFKIISADNQVVPFEPSDQAVDPAQADERSSVYGFKTGPLDPSRPARLVVAAASEVNYPAGVSFTFDPGPDRKPQQTWEVNKDLELDGRTLRIKTITITEMGGNASVEFEMESPDGIIGAGVSDLAHPASSGSSMLGDGVSPVQHFCSGYNLDGSLPAGPLTLTVTGYTLRLPGPWEVEWTPAAIPTPAAVTNPSNQGACLTESTWKEALSNPRPLNEKVTSRILVEQETADPNVRSLTLMQLDGAEPQVVSESGHDAAISLDGQYAAYLAPDGLTVQALNGGSKLVIPETANINGVFRAFWPSHGPRLAYTGTPGGASPNIYLTDLDGSNPILAPSPEPIRLMQGWLADGSILYIGFGESGPALKLLNPVSGEAITLFNVPQISTTFALTKDDRLLAMVWQDEPQGKQILYVQPLDGSQRKTILEVPGEGYIRTPVWFPDGQWLLVDLSWKLPEAYTKALVNVDTCEIIPLPKIDGIVDDWVP